ncbi:hypothetical protein [Reyranella sp.]|uniref:hypothetical protein n=1 Tax=Reyranella sp. TaxID=1929291 RepID=UPI003BA8F71F
MLRVKGFLLLPLAAVALSAAPAIAQSRDATPADKSRGIDSDAPSSPRAQSPGDTDGRRGPPKAPHRTDRNGDGMMRGDRGQADGSGRSRHRHHDQAQAPRGDGQNSQTRRQDPRPGQAHEQRQGQAPGRMQDGMRGQAPGGAPSTQQD